MPVYPKISGSYKTVNSANDCYVKINGAWKKCDQVYVKVSGTWKRCFETIQIEAAANWGIIHVDDGRNYLSNVQVGSVVTICFNANIWVTVDSEGYGPQGTVLRNSMFVTPHGAYASGSNVWLNNQNNYGDLYYVDIDRRYSKWVSLQYIATSSNPSFDVTWPRGPVERPWYMGGSNEWGFNITDDRIEYTRETRS